MFCYSRQTALMKWNHTWCGRFNEFDKGILFASEMYRRNLELSTYTIRHDSEGVLTTVSISTNTVIGYYYGKVVYHNLPIGECRNLAFYREGSLAVTVKDSSKRALKLQSSI